jgi:hypothetical protein
MLLPDSTKGTNALSARLKTWSNPMERDNNTRILGMGGSPIAKGGGVKSQFRRVLRRAPGRKEKQKPTQKPCSS